MTEAIIVAPDRDGWVVSHQSTGQQQKFASGQTAEAMARQWAGALAAEGRITEVVIYLRDGSLAGRFVCKPERLRELA